MGLIERTKEIQDLQRLIQIILRFMWNTYFFTALKKVYLIMMGSIPKIRSCSSRHVERSRNIANCTQWCPKMSPRWST